MGTRVTRAALSAQVLTVEEADAGEVEGPRVAAEAEGFLEKPGRLLTVGQQRAAACQALSPRVHEIVILTVGAAWASDYELYAHKIVGRLAGLPEEVIHALISHRPPDLQDEEEASAYEFTHQLIHEHRIDAATYARAADAFGREGLVDMVMLIGLYVTTCAIINAFEVPAPEETR